MIEKLALVLKIVFGYIYACMAYWYSTTRECFIYFTEHGFSLISLTVNVLNIIYIKYFNRPNKINKALEIIILFTGLRIILSPEVKIIQILQLHSNIVDL